MVVLLEIRLECVFKRHHQTFCGCLVGDWSFKARPLLAVNVHLAFLVRDELFVTENKRDRGVSIAEKLALFALVNDSETGSPSCLHLALVRKPCQSEVEECSLLGALNVGKGVWA